MFSLSACPKPRFRLTATFLLFFLMICAASAAPLHWQLNGATLIDGGKVFGGFDYDAVTGTYSNIALTTTLGSVLGGSYYNTLAPSGSSATALVGVSTVPIFPMSTLSLALTFSAPLTGAGGTVSINGTTAQESLCSNATCSTPTPQRQITGGSVSAISSSAPKRWYIHNVILSDGAEVFGSFVFDAITGTYSSISVTSSIGKSGPSAGYFLNVTAASTANALVLVSASPIVANTTTTLAINFNSGLTNAGGTVGLAALTGVVEGTCTSLSCGSSTALRSSAVPGSVSTDQEDSENLILPQIADGGGFVTELLITNPTGDQITCRVTFWQDNGTLLPLSLNGSNASASYVVVVPGHSTQFLATPGVGPSVEGWALVDHVQRLGVIAAFRLHVPNLPESEATVQGIVATPGFAMPFDETTGFDTGFALANVSAFDTVIENLFFYDTNGAYIYSDTTHSLPPHAHEAFFFSSRYGTQLAGKRGTVRVYYGVQGTPANGTVGLSALGLSALGLRTNPGGTFTSLPTFAIGAN